MLGINTSFFGGGFLSDKSVMRNSDIQKKFISTFKLDKTYREKESASFEIIFIGEDEIKYKYYLEVDLNKKIILKEVAFYSPNGQEKILFEKVYKKSSKKYNYNFEPLSIDIKREEAIRNTSINENEDDVLLISILERFKVIKIFPITNFAKRSGFLKNENVKNLHSLIPSFNLALKNKNFKSFILNLLKEIIDKSIFDIKVEKLFNSKERLLIIRKNEKNEEVEFDLREESSGTQKIFGSLEFLYSFSTSKNSEFILFDEFENDLHPLLMEYIIKNFVHSNKSRSQVVFATHSTTLIGKTLNLFRRDQIWLTQRGYNNNTEIYPLTDCSERSSEDFEKYYLYGRYGAIMGLEDEDYEL